MDKKAFLETKIFGFAASALSVMFPVNSVKAQIQKVCLLRRSEIVRCGRGLDLCLWGWYEYDPNPLVDVATYAPSSEPLVDAGYDAAWLKVIRDLGFLGRGGM